jgi:hypothetical protein
MAKTRKLSAGLKAWTAHWKKVRAEMEKKGTFKKGDNLTKVFKEAKKSFHHKKGGADGDPESNEPTGVNVPNGVNVPTDNIPGDGTNKPSEGGRKRRGSKTRRHRK